MRGWRVVDASDAISEQRPGPPPLARRRGRHPPITVQEVLELVGLADVADRRSTAVCSTANVDLVQRLGADGRTRGKVAVTFNGGER